MSELSVRTGAAYIRVSTDDQVELSPDSQLELILEYAKKNNIVVPEEFVFIEGEKKKGLSGRRASNRPKFQNMIALAKEIPKPFDCILLWKYSRFARNIDEATYYKSVLRNKCGVDVISISEPKIEGMYGRLIEMIIEWSDEFYSFNLATEVKRGLAARAKAGEFSSYAPFGYKMQDKKLVTDEERAPFVRLVFSEYANGTPVRQIATRLNEMGVRTRFGNPIDNRFVTYMVSNPIYKGDIVFSIDGKRKRGELDSDAVIRRKGVHEPIVSESLFDSAYERFSIEQGRQRRSADKNEYALRSLLKCSNCGATLTYCANGRLQCSKYNRGVCHVSHSVEADFAEKMVLAQLRLDSTNAVIKQKVVKNSAFSVDNTAAINSIRRKLQRADEAYLNEIYSTEEYKTMRKELFSQISVLEEEERKAKEEAVTTTPCDVVKVLDRYTEYSPKEKNQALISLLHKVVVKKEVGGFCFELFYK